MTLDNSKVDELQKEIAKKYLYDLGYTEITNVNKSLVYIGKGDGMKTTQVYCKLTNVDNTECWTIDEYLENNLQEFATSNIKLIRLEGIIHNNYNVTDFHPRILKDL